MNNATHQNATHKNARDFDILRYLSKITYVSILKEPFKNLVDFGALYSINRHCGRNLGSRNPKKQFFGRILASRPVVGKIKGLLAVAVFVHFYIILQMFLDMRPPPSFFHHPPALGGGQSADHSREWSVGGAGGGSLGWSGGGGGWVERGWGGGVWWFLVGT